MSPTRFALLAMSVHIFEKRTVLRDSPANDRLHFAFAIARHDEGGLQPLLLLAWTLALVLHSEISEHFSTNIRAHICARKRDTLEILPWTKTTNTAL